MSGFLPDQLETKIESSAIEKQVGGSHYDSAIQPTEFILANDIPFLEAQVLKYIMRHSRKNGIEDLRKAQHYLEFLAEHDYGEKL